MTNNTLQGDYLEGFRRIHEEDSYTYFQMHLQRHPIASVPISFLNSLSTFNLESERSCRFKQKGETSGTQYKISICKQYTMVQKTDFVALTDTHITRLVVILILKHLKSSTASRAGRSGEVQSQVMLQTYHWKWNDHGITNNWCQPVRIKYSSIMQKCHT